MERFRCLDRYQKFILLALLIMALVFGAVYCVIANREGYLYMGAILVPSQEGSANVYSGKIDGQKASFTVTADTVTFLRGDTVYGPYVLREDPSAIPADDALAPYMTGIVITDNGREFFRGAVMEDSHDFHLFREDGSAVFAITMTTENGISYDMDGNPIDPYKPTPHTIVRLLRGPELTQKGYWQAYLLGLLLSGMVIVSMLFADDLFRFRMSFRVMDISHIEPSGWEMSSRYIGWTLMSVVILFLYFAGLH